MSEYCGRCMLEFRMALDPGKPWGIVLPPHHPRCPKVAVPYPAPLLPELVPHGGRSPWWRLN